MQPRSYRVAFENEKLRVLEFVSRPGMLSALQLAAQMQGRCHVVFITACEAHAVAAFEQGAIDYVLKPYDNARLALTVHRVKERLSTPPLSQWTP